MTNRLSDEDLPIIQDLGAWLRRERERAGITLETIAARTKVARTLLEGLERNDVSRWPNGIFRRAFVRGYAVQIGSTPTTPSRSSSGPSTARTPPRRSWIGPPRAPPSASAVSPGRAEPSLRLTLAPEVSRWQEALARLGAATTDLMAPITLALPSGLLGGLSLFWLVLAVVGVLYLTVGTLVLGTTPGLWMMQRVGSQPLGARRMPLGKATSALGFGDDAEDADLDAEANPRQAWNSSGFGG